jgi:hypothetical protein
MTYADHWFATNGGPPVSGRAYDKMNRFISMVFIDTSRTVGQARHAQIDSLHISSERTHLEQMLFDFQTNISDFSMYLPNGFAKGLNCQFANMFDKDTWEADDDLPSLGALQTFLTLLHRTHTQRRPGIGTNGRGSITAFWKAGDSRLTVECYEKNSTKWVLTRAVKNESPELAAGECLATNLLSRLQPYEPEVWFGQ